MNRSAGNGRRYCCRNVSGSGPEFKGFARQEAIPPFHTELWGGQVSSKYTLKRGRLAVALVGLAAAAAVVTSVSPASAASPGRTYHFYADKDYGPEHCVTVGIGPVSGPVCQKLDGVLQLDLWSTDLSGHNVIKAQATMESTSTTRNYWIDFDAWDTAGHNQMHVQGATQSPAWWYTRHWYSWQYPSPVYFQTGTFCATLYDDIGPTPSFVQRTCISIVPSGLAG